MYWRFIKAIMDFFSDSFLKKDIPITSLVGSQSM